MNDCQQRVIRSVAEWFHPEAKPDCKSPFVLVHGVFGSVCICSVSDYATRAVTLTFQGKSHLLAATVIFLCRAFDILGDNSSRILIASLTNVAVDRILLSLQDRQFTDFSRVGSVKRVAKPLLQFVMHW